MPTTRTNQAQVNQFIQGLERLNVQHERSGLPILCRDSYEIFVVGSGPAVDIDYFDDARIPLSIKTGELPNGRIKNISRYRYIDNTFGVTKKYHDNLPFDDMQKFDILTFMNDGHLPYKIYPIILSSPNHKDPFSTDGVIEPLLIRTIVGFKNTFLLSEGYPGSINASFASEKEQFLNQFYYQKSRASEDSDWAEDAPGTGAPGTTGDIEKSANLLLEPEYVADKKVYTDPYVEADKVEIKFRDVEMKTILLNNLKLRTAQRHPRGTTASSSGFIGGELENYDSIAYRDRRR